MTCIPAYDLGVIDSCAERFETILKSPATELLTLEYGFAGTKYTASISAVQGKEIVFRGEHFPDSGIVEFSLFRANGEPIVLNGNYRFKIELICSLT